MLVYGQNEAHDRLMKELHEVNSGGIEYPSATNNRGQMSSGEVTRQSSRGKREPHAMGDSVGNMAQPGEMLGNPMRKGGRAAYMEGEKVTAQAEQPGEHLRRNFRKGGLARHRMRGDD